MFSKVLFILNLAGWRLKTIFFYLYETYVLEFLKLHFPNKLNIYVYNSEKDVSNLTFLQIKLTSTCSCVFSSFVSTSGKDFSSVFSVISATAQSSSFASRLTFKCFKCCLKVLYLSRFLLILLSF